MNARTICLDGLQDIHHKGPAAYLDDIVHNTSLALDLDCAVD